MKLNIILVMWSCVVAFGATDPPAFLGKTDNLPKISSLLQLLTGGLSINRTRTNQPADLWKFGGENPFQGWGPGSDQGPDKFLASIFAGKSGQGQNDISKFININFGGQRPQGNPLNWIQKGSTGNDWSPKPSMADVVKMAMSLMGNKQPNPNWMVNSWRPGMNGEPSQFFNMNFGVQTPPGQWDMNDGPKFLGSIFAGNGMKPGPMPGMLQKFGQLLNGREEGTTESMNGMDILKNQLTIDLAKQSAGRSTASSRWDMIRKLISAGGLGARSGSSPPWKEMMMKKLLGGSFDEPRGPPPFVTEMLRNKMGGSGMPFGGKYGPPAFIKEMIKNKLSRYGMSSKFDMSRDGSDLPLALKEMMKRRLGGFGMSQNQPEIPPFVKEMIMRKMMSGMPDMSQKPDVPPAFLTEMMKRRLGGFGTSQDQLRMPPFVREMIMRKILRGGWDFGMPPWNRPRIPPFMNMMRMPYRGGEGFRMPFDNSLQFLKQMMMDKREKSPSDMMGSNGMYKGLKPMLLQMLMGNKMPSGDVSIPDMVKGLPAMKNPFSMLSSMPWGMKPNSISKPSEVAAEIITTEVPTSSTEKAKAKKEGKGKKCVTKCVEAGKCMNSDLIKIAMIIAPENCKSCLKNKCENLTTDPLCFASAQKSCADVCPAVTPGKIEKIKECKSCISDCKKPRGEVKEDIVTESEGSGDEA